MRLLFFFPVSSSILNLVNFMFYLDLGTRKQVRGLLLHSVALHLETSRRRFHSEADLLCEQLCFLGLNQSGRMSPVVAVGLTVFCDTVCFWQHTVDEVLAVGL